jgi:hypothetical protein
MAGRACENRPAVRRPCKRGRSLGHAERLRKLLSNAPSAEERAQLRATFGNDSPSRWPRRSGRYWPITGRGLCKAHAASYAVVAYRMAYCKAHYPAELPAAVLDNQAGFYPPQVYIEETRRLGGRTTLWAGPQPQCGGHAGARARTAAGGDQGTAPGYGAGAAGGPAGRRPLRLAA